MSFLTAFRFLCELYGVANERKKKKKKKKIFRYLRDGSFTDGIFNRNKNQKWDPLRAMKTFIRKKMGHTT